MMFQLKIGSDDVLNAIGDALHELGKPAGADGMREASRLALNRTLDWTYTRVVRRTAEASGMQQARVRKIERKVPARKATGIAGPVAMIVSRDGYTSLADFHPRQTKQGVIASPWGKKRLFPHTFLGPGGHVYRRLSKNREPIKKLYGPAIPKEMTREETIRPLINEAMAVQYPMHLEFFEGRAFDRQKAKHQL